MGVATAGRMGGNKCRIAFNTYTPLPVVFERNDLRLQVHWLFGPVCGSAKELHE